MQDNMQVRYLDWAESLACEQTPAEMPNKFSSGANQASEHAERLQDQSATQSPAPHVPSDRTFDVIIGTDILYEVWPDVIGIVLWRSQMSCHSTRC